MLKISGIQGTVLQSKFYQYAKLIKVFKVFKMYFIEIFIFENMGKIYEKFNFINCKVFFLTFLYFLIKKYFIF